MKPYATVVNAGTSNTNKTGSWRTERPQYVHRLPPCNKACPAGENIQEWLALTERGDNEGAWREIVKNNPFPAIMGRVCYHPCEGACNRVIVDNPVGINSVELFLGDMALTQKWALPKVGKATGKKILIVGAGPAGLSAAYQMALMGHKVVVREERKKAGGMLRWGIPAYRLPRKILDAEIKRILDLGVTLELGKKVADLKAAMEKESFDAVFLSTGAHLPKLTDIPCDPKAKILDAVAVLRDMEGTDKPKLGKRVVVYGGGNTAMDVARTAKRLGAKDVTIVYRRTREKMPAHSFEVDEALQEGVNIKFLVTIKSYKNKKIVLEKMALDSKGSPQPTGKKESMEADSIVLALGQDAELAYLESMGDMKAAGGFLPVDDRMMTTVTGVFAGGDMIPCDRTATTAIGHGKKAARHIDAWLRQAEYTNAKPELASSDRLNKWYYEPAPRMEREQLDPIKRAKTFDEVQKGLTAADALTEAKRCLSCGNCFECDNCYGVCPDNAIRKLGTGKGFEIDYEYCKGCGLCAFECPCGCIEMVPEDK